MKTEKSFLNKKIMRLLFLPLAFTAVFYLIAATEISYIFNVPMIMSPMETGISMQTGQATAMPANEMRKAGLPVSFLKIVRQHSGKLNLGSCVTCMECQNLPTAGRPENFYYGSIIKTVSFKKQSYIKHFSSGIPHPPQNVSVA